MNLTYAAYSRCPCGAGLAYDDQSVKNPWKGYWDCSEIILGTAKRELTHTAQLPFTFYEVKSENQPSVYGASTRPN